MNKNELIKDITKIQADSERMKELIAENDVQIKRLMYQLEEHCKLELLYILSNHHQSIHIESMDGNRMVLTVDPIEETWKMDGVGVSGVSGRGM